MTRALTAFSSLERALLRLLVSGHSLESASHAVGLSVPDAEALLREMQRRHGVSCLPRLLALAVLNAWT